MIKKILYIVNIVFAVLLLLSYLTAFIPPHIYPKFSLIGFVYPILLFINIAFILVWIFIKWTYAIIPLACILIRFDYIPSLIRIDGDKHSQIIQKDEIKILSYNVCAFHYNTLYNQSKQGKIDSVINYIKEQNPDIIAFQDYASSKKPKSSIHYSLTKKLGYKYYYGAESDDNHISSNVIYSKFPIQKSGMILPMRENSDSYIFIDIKVKGKSFRIYNFHLTSFKLADKEKEDFAKIKQGEIKPQASKNIIKKLVWANDKRSKEVDEIIPILRETSLPYFVVGDFNDTPFSYTYRNISKDMKDSFEEKGEGFGTTYNGIFPAYRIDYILFSKNDFSIKSFETNELEYSDHFPVSAIFSIDKK